MSAYIMGSEVLWRMTGASVFYEYGKYLTVLVLIAALVRHGRVGIPKQPLFYFVLLLPSTLLTLDELSPPEARSQISFNLSGPLALIACATFFSKVGLTVEQLLRLLLVALGPLVATAAVALYSVASTADIEFRNRSNFAASGGFGPNQVSAVLALGSMIVVLALLVVKGSKAAKITLGLVAVMLAAQSALTFSRGGLWSAGAALAIALLLLAGDARTRVRTLLLAVFVTASGAYLAPYLDQYTEGALLSRFGSIEATGRERILLADLELWAANPVFGVGPGVALSQRETILDARVAAHTEFSRLLAEHGLLGATALVLLIGMTWSNIKRKPPGPGRAIITALIVWSVANMSINAMRTVAPSFALGIGFASILPLAKPRTNPERRERPVDHLRA